MLRSLLQCVVSLAFFGAAASADLYQVRIQTVEWLVDNSDVIAVFHVAEDGRFAKTFKVLKGDAQTVSFPLKPTDQGGYQYLKQPVSGEIRLCFIRGRKELLQEVDLAREALTNGPSLSRVTYGVSQYGEILLTQRALFQSIIERVKSGPGISVKRNDRRIQARASGVDASWTFPLESGDHTYVLIVPFTRQLRDHYLEQLNTGTASERIDAIRVLANFADSASWEAIRKAAGRKDVVADFHFFPNGMAQTGLMDVQDAVREALRSEAGRLENRH